MASRFVGLRALLGRGAGPALRAPVSLVASSLEALPLPLPTTAAEAAAAPAGSLSSAQPRLAASPAVTDAARGLWRGYAFGLVGQRTVDHRPQQQHHHQQQPLRAFHFGAMAGSGLIPGERGAGVVMASRGMATRRSAQKATHSLRFKGGKHKAYTSLKERFKVLKSLGMVKRGRKGYRHRRSQKSKEQKYRLRKPATVYKAYAKVMKKLGMKGF